VVRGWFEEEGKKFLREEELPKYEYRECERDKAPLT